MIGDSSPIYWLKHFRRFIADDNEFGFQWFYSILFFLMASQDMAITQENFHYS
jgi:hypothetical protein